MVVVVVVGPDEVATVPSPSARAVENRRVVDDVVVVVYDGGGEMNSSNDRSGAG
jgi:hypothetical protein